VAKFKENQKKNSYDVTAHLLTVPSTTRHTITRCPVLRTKVEVNDTYSDIYMEDIPTDVSKTLMENC
jgi:hypothetical protein